MHGSNETGQGSSGVFEKVQTSLPLPLDRTIFGHRPNLTAKWGPQLQLWLTLVSKPEWAHGATKDVPKLLWTLLGMCNGSCWIGQSLGENFSPTAKHEILGDVGLGTFAGTWVC